MQLFLNKGTYGGDTILKEEMIDKYTSAPLKQTIIEEVSPSTNQLEMALEAQPVLSVCH